MEQPPEPAAAADPGPCTAAPQAHSPAQAAPPHACGPPEAAAPAAERRQSRPGAGPGSGAERAGAAASACGEARDGRAGGEAPASCVSSGGAGDWRAGRDARVTHPDRVFVSVAAYRDEEAQWTVADLLRRAARPGRVRIGIVWQARARACPARMRVRIVWEARARACPERMRVSIVWQARARAHAGGPRGAARALLPEAGHPWARHVLFSWVPSQNSHSACSRRAGMAARMGHCLPARQEAAPALQVPESPVCTRGSVRPRTCRRALTRAAGGRGGGRCLCARCGLRRRARAVGAAGAAPARGRPACLRSARACTECACSACGRQRPLGNRRPSQRLPCHRAAFVADALPPAAG